MGGVLLLKWYARNASFPYHLRITIIKTASIETKWEWDYSYYARRLSFWNKKIMRKISYSVD